MTFGSMAKKLRIEQLEDKRLLAADLSVDVVNGDLIITGDAGANKFQIVDATLSGHQYEVELSGAPDDTINGNEVSSVFVDGVTGNILIDTGDGGDEVLFRGGNLADVSSVLPIPNDLVISTGNDSDLIVLGRYENVIGFPFRAPVNIGGDLRVFGGDGSDIFEFTALTVADDLTYFDLQGDNSLQANLNDDLEFSEVGDDFRAILGSGADEVSLLTLNVADDLLLATDGGDDIVDVSLVNAGGAVSVGLGSGTNEASFFQVDAGHAFSLYAGGSSNVIVLDGITASHFITVITASGDDEVSLVDSETHSALIATGAGDDAVFIIDSVFDYLAVATGSGDDTLDVGGVTVNRWAVFSGGFGDDVFTDLGDNDINWQFEWGF